MTGGSSTITVPDGRRIEAWASDGSSSTGLLFHFGTPCAGVPYAPLAKEAASRGWRFVTYSRPGYSGSTRRAGRSVADCAEDVAALVAHLGLDRLYVVGWSGGGPHALACAARLPDLVASTATLAGVAPWDADGLDWLDGMAGENRDEFAAALDGEDSLERFLVPFASELAAVTPETVAETLGGLVTDVDRAAITGDFAEYQATVFRAAVSSGIWGWLDDDLAFTRPWGFALDDIAVPVTVWQGRQDAMVPYPHGEWLAGHIRGAEAMLLEGEGHLTLLARFGEVVERLVDRV
jgi:pimeloyl-ACP methyl ester carboxylesterase